MMEEGRGRSCCEIGRREGENAREGVGSCVTGEKGGRKEMVRTAAEI